MTQCIFLHTQIQDDTLHFSTHRSSGWHIEFLYTVTHRSSWWHTDFFTHRISWWHIAFFYTQKFWWHTALLYTLKFHSNFMWRAQIPLRIRFHETTSWTQNMNKLSCNVPLLLVLLQHPWPSLVHLECSAFSETVINDTWTANIHEWNPWGKTVMMTDPILWPLFL